MKEILMGKIRIIKNPESLSVPKEVCRAWVGLELPCEPILGLSNDEHDPITGEQRKSGFSFNVPISLALDILKEHDQKAYMYWKNMDFSNSDTFFCFKESDAEIIYGVTRQTIIEVTDEMRGDPNR